LKSCYNNQDKEELNQMVEEALAKIEAIDCTKTDSSLFTFCYLNKIVEDATSYLEKLKQRNGRYEGN
jgi:hypothetical protein